MKIILFCVAAFGSFLSCSSGGDQQQNNNTSESTDTVATEQKTSEEKKTGTLNDVFSGMPAEKVLEVLGYPSSVDTLNASENMPIQDWWYGSNQKVRMMDGKVNRVVKDVAKEREIMKKIVEAKKNNDEKELKRLEEELVNQSY